MVFDFREGQSSTSLEALRHMSQLQLRWYQGSTPWYLRLSWSHRRRRFLEWIYVFASDDLVVDLLAKGDHVSGRSHLPVHSFRFLSSKEVAQGKPKLSCLFLPWRTRRLFRVPSGPGKPCENAIWANHSRQHSAIGGSRRVVRVGPSGSPSVFTSLEKRGCLRATLVTSRGVGANSGIFF